MKKIILVLMLFGTANAAIDKDLLIGEYIATQRMARDVYKKCLASDVDFGVCFELDIIQSNLRSLNGYLVGILKNEELNCTPAFIQQ